VCDHEDVKTNLGRNDPCHCGSGKKYKQCHLEKDEAAERETRAKEQAAAAAAEPAPAAEGTAEPVHPRETRPQQAQPWKRGQQGPRSVPRFNAPRRSGGS